MENMDPNEPIFELHVNGVHVATLFAPEWEEMFWCSYRLEPTSDEGDAAIRDEKTWETVNFTVTDCNGRFPNSNTFTGGYREFCDRKSDRLSFRSLWPPRPKRSTAARLWLAKRLKAILRWSGYTPRNDQRSA